MEHSRRFAFCAACEGLTLILLLFVAVPLKHFGGHPEMVRLLGPLHGLAFLAYSYALYALYGEEAVTPRQAGLGMLAAFFPSGSLIFERWLRR